MICKQTMSFNFCEGYPSLRFVGSYAVFFW